jgi:UDP-glucose 4-epimerase
MRALITGGAGFIGSHLAESLLGAGHGVTIVDDLSTGRFENISHLTGLPGLQFVAETITNEMITDRLIRECDVVFHLAAAVGVQLIVSDPVRVIETNIFGTHAILKLANRYRKKVFLASTSEIYGKGNHAPFKEDDDRILGPTTRSRWCYSASKGVDEFLALAYWKEKALPVVIFRLFNTIGVRQTGQYGMVVPRFVSQALKGDPISVYGDGQQSRCFCDVSDAARAIIELADCPKAVGEVFNVGSTTEITILELARRVKALTGSRSEIVFVPYEKAYEKGFDDMRRRVPDISKISHVIGWTPRLSLDESLERIITYTREHPV